MAMGSSARRERIVEHQIGMIDLLHHLQLLFIDNVFDVLTYQCRATAGRHHDFPFLRGDHTR